MQLTPGSTAVVAIHMQGDVVTPEGAFGPFFAEQVAERHTIDKVKTLLDAARTAGATVAYTRVAWAPDYSDLNANSPMLGMVLQGGCLKDGTALADIVDDLKPHDGDVVITHKRISGFSNSDLDSELKQRGIDTVVFCGVATNVSVEGTARQSSDLGYRTVIVADACAAGGTEAHEASIGSLGLIGEIATLEDVVAALGA